MQTGTTLKTLTIKINTTEHLNIKTFQTEISWLQICDVCVRLRETHN